MKHQASVFTINKCTSNALHCVLYNSSLMNTGSFFYSNCISIHLPFLHSTIKRTTLHISVFQIHTSTPKTLHFNQSLPCMISTCVTTLSSYLALCTMDLPIFYDNNGSHRDSCLEDVYRSLVSVANLPTNLLVLFCFFEAII